MALPLFQFNCRHSEVSDNVCTNGSAQARAITVHDHASTAMTVNVRVVLGTWREFLVY